MELSLRLVTRPVPGITPKVILIIIIIVTILAAWSAGQEPVTVISLIAGAGLAGAQAAPVPGKRGQAELPPGKPGPKPR